VCKPNSKLYIIFYADDIILIAPTITLLEKLVHNYFELELSRLDMMINFKKLSCLHIGLASWCEYADIVSFSGHLIPSVKETRYILILILSVQVFLDAHSVWRNAPLIKLHANAILGMIGGKASEEVI